MDALPPACANFGDGAAAIDDRAPPEARVLLMLCRIDGELESLHLEELALMRRLEKVRRDARAAHEEFRAQEIQLMFVESSGRYAALPEALQRLRECLEAASQRYRDLAAFAEGEASKAASGFELVKRRVEFLNARRQGLAPAPKFAVIYETSAWFAMPPRVVAVERESCGACGAAAPARLEGDLRPCAGCRRILYWPRG